MKLKVVIKFPYLYYLLIVFYYSFCSSSALSQTYRKSYYSVQEGLSQNEVTSIIQDTDGFIWLGTRGGLNRFDGYKFKKFKPYHGIKNGLNNPSIECLYKTNNGNILIGTKSGGFSIYNHYNDKIEIFRNLRNGKTPNRIISFYEDCNKNIWLGSWSKGLTLIPNNRDTLIQYFNHLRITKIIQTPDSTLWIATSDGFRYRTKGGEFKSLKVKRGYHEITDIVYDDELDCIWLTGWDLGVIKFNYKSKVFENVINTDDINSPYVLKLDNDKLWIGTWGNGLFYLNTNEYYLNKVDIKKEDDNAYNIDYDIVLDIFLDKVGDIWIGTDGGGVVHLTPKSRFNTLSHKLGAKYKNMHVSSVLEDNKKRLWIGTKGGGLFVVEDGSISKVHYLGKDKYFDFQIPTVKALYQSSDNTIWVSFTNGLYLIKESKNDSFELQKVSEAFNSPDLDISFKARDVLVVNNQLWIATQQKGLYLFNKVGDRYFKKRQFTSVNTQSIKENRITSLVFDNDSNLWISTYKGLYHYNTNDSSFINIDKFIKDEVEKPLCDIIICTYLDKQNNIWFGTPCSLNVLFKDKDGNYKLNDYTINDGFTDDYINGILGDQFGKIWLSTNAGISCLNTKTNEIINYDSSDGVGGTSFSETATYRSREGVLYFGSRTDLTYFKPEEISTSNITPKVAITDFRILNRSVEIAHNSVLKSNINIQPKITLSHKENEFSFEFASLDYRASQKNQYAYQLLGYNDSLVFVGGRRHISFSNLKPGDYTLKLIGTNSTGVWSDTSRLISIEIKTAPWKTWYAISIYVIVVLGVFVFVGRIRLTQEQLKNNLKIVQLKRKQESEFNEYKFNFFTNISHELRTPLTLILAPIKELISKDREQLQPSSIETKLRLIHQNANRLQHLINQLLEYRKIEAGKTKLMASEINFKEWISDMLIQFKEFAKTSRIDFRYSFKGTDWMCFIDIYKMEMVVNNLLSNAFKYSGNPGEVSVVIQESKSNIVVAITNNGRGISISDQNKLFERFYQVDQNSMSGSSGIGLALVKSYVDLHRGEVLVESELNKYTTFEVSIKKGKEHFDPDEIIEKKVSLMDAPQSSKIEIEKPVREKSTNKNEIVIVVEDNYEVRSYIVDLLAKEYQVLEAENGKNGLVLIEKHKPSLIISDVMMPVMDGLELCHKVKSNESLLHIPIILLTAKGTIKDQLQGTKRGADIYLTKPFEPELLKEKVKVLIASRAKLSSIYAKKILLAPNDSEITTEESKFIETTIDIIEKNMNKPEFDAEQLANMMAMSSSTFYRKTKRITQKTPGEFIKIVRIQRAAQLLQKTEMSISEIAEKIGYSDLKSFRNNFKHLFKKTPQEYRGK